MAGAKCGLTGIPGQSWGRSPSYFGNKSQFPQLFAVFFIAAPFVLMYAQGYGFDWHKKNWVKTGVLFLESKPSRADIYLNNRKHKQKTTARLSRLIPGEYDVKIVKDGFKAWEKKLTVYPNCYM